MHHHITHTIPITACLVTLSILFLYTPLLVILVLSDRIKVSGVNKICQIRLVKDTFTLTHTHTQRRKSIFHLGFARLWHLSLIHM